MQCESPQCLTTLFSEETSKYKPSLTKDFFCDHRFKEKNRCLECNKDLTEELAVQAVEIVQDYLENLTKES